MAVDRRYFVGPVQSGFAVLEAVMNMGRPISLDEIARISGLPRTTAYRHARTLQELGYLAAAAARRYEVGPKFALVATSAMGDRALRAVADDELSHLHRIYAQTANLAVPRGRRIEYVSVLPDRPTGTPGVAPGDCDHLHSTALGKSILAFLPDAERENCLRGALPRVTPRTTIDRRHLVRLLSQVRQFGFAFDREENEVGCVCVAAPIFAAGDRPIAAISVSIRAADFSPAVELNAATAVADSARRISARLARRSTAIS